MCGRYSNTAEFSEIRLGFQVEQLELFRDWQPTYNISPNYSAGTEQLIIVSHAGAMRALRLARWWMIPASWQKPLGALPTAFNARAEEIGVRPFWRGAFQGQRCLVPATGWREFVDRASRKQPYHFTPDAQSFAFAGLWASWKGPSGQDVDSFAIVTTAPSEQAAVYHDRMPLIVPAGLHGAWLADDDVGGVLHEAQASSQSRRLDIFPSDPIANNSRYEGPRATRRVPEQQVFVQQTLFADPESLEKS